MSTVHKDKRGKLAHRRETGASARTADPRERWANIPGLHVREEWPPTYAKFTPVRLKNGESASEQLIRERR